MQFFLCWGLYTSKLQISASLKNNISLTSSVEYRCLRILGLLTLETRFLRADLIEVFKILRGFENLDPDRCFQVIEDGVRRGTVLNCSRRGIVWTCASTHENLSSHNNERGTVERSSTNGHTQRYTIQT